MRGEFIEVWSETWREIWNELESDETAPDDLFCELYRELLAALKVQPSDQQLVEIINNPDKSKEAFKKIRFTDLIGEQSLVKFLENIQRVLDDLSGDPLSNHYFNLLTAFIDKFNLRYDLRRPCTLCPTLPGMFASLVRDLRMLTSQDAHLNSLMKDFENAVRNLRTDCSDGQIKTCIQKQVNLLEAMGCSYPGVTRNTLGGICEEVGTWPHSRIKDAMKNLYGFASDYPGIRHGGTPANAIRDIDMRDMIAMSILLSGFVPYLTDQLDAEVIYRGR